MARLNGSCPWMSNGSLNSMHNAYSIYPLSLSKLTQIKCWAMASDQTSQGAQAAQSPATILAIGTANPANFIYQADYPDYYFRVTRSEHMTDLKGKFKRLCKWLMWWKLSISWLSKKCRGACSSYKWMFMIDLSFFFFPSYYSDRLFWPDCLLIFNNNIYDRKI